MSKLDFADCIAAGKGDKYRKVDRKKYEANYDRIFRKRKKK